MGLLSEKKEALYAELNKKLDAAISYSVTGGFFLPYIYSALVARNHQKIQSRCLINEFSFTNIFSNINHGNRAAIMKKNFL